MNIFVLITFVHDVTSLNVKLQVGLKLQTPSTGVPHLDDCTMSARNAVHIDTYNSYIRSYQIDYLKVANVFKGIISFKYR